MDIVIEKEKIHNLSQEKRLIILLSRISFSNSVLKEVETILKDKNFNWFEFYQYAFYHKVLTLCWKNINKYFPNIYQPKYAKEIIQVAYMGLKKRNSLFQKELVDIVKCLEKENIIAIPVKGAHLISKVYKDYGVRYSGDMDFLIKYEQVRSAEAILESKGYIKGYYDNNEKEIIKISRKEDIKWKTFMSNNYPLLKKSNNNLFSVYKVDLRFALDDKLKKEPINEIIDIYVQLGKVKPAHYLLHLCTHFFDEATHLVDIALAKDMNIIKLCDIREYIIKCVAMQDLKELVWYAKKYKLQNQVYITMFFLEVIYGDGFGQKVIEELNWKKELAISSVGDSTLEYSTIDNLDIVHRLFSYAEIKRHVPKPKLWD